MSEPAEWQRGYSLEQLKSLTAVFKEADAPYVHGAFTGWKERDAADALASGTLSWRAGPDGTPTACAVVRTVQQQQGIKDFTGEVRCRMLPGDVVVSRWAFLPGHESEAYALLSSAAAEVGEGGALFVTRWQESAEQAAVLSEFPLQLVATKIPASSEVLGVYGMGRRQLDYLPVPVSDTWGLRRLHLSVPEERLDRARAAVQRMPGWADHYSSYNKAKSWSAVSLRGYDDDPFVIVKPAEMSKKWKADNPALMAAQVRDTVARKAVPELEELIELVPGSHQRIRLMRLMPGGGELTRHADITDPEAGTATGRVLRIHLPLVSNPAVLFTSWDLQGTESTRHMAPGSAWYLDTRKPHTAVNNGPEPRIHLVVDTYSSPELLAMLEQGSSTQ